MGVMVPQAGARQFHVNSLVEGKYFLLKAGSVFLLQSPWCLLLVVSHGGMLGHDITSVVIWCYI